MKSIITVNGTLGFPQIITSDWVSVDDYTGIRVDCKATGGSGLITISGANNPGDIDFSETYESLANSTCNIEIGTRFNYYRVVAFAQNDQWAINLSARFYNKTGKTVKCINWDSTYDVEEFETLDFKIRNATILTSQVDSQAKIIYFTSVSNAFKEADVIELKTVDINDARPLSGKVDYGGYFITGFNGSIITDYEKPYGEIRTFDWSSNIKGLEGKYSSNPLTIGINTNSSNSHSYSNLECVPIFNEIVNQYIPQTHVQAGGYYDVRLSIQEDATFTEILNHLKSHASTIYMFLDPLQGNLFEVVLNNTQSQKCTMSLQNKHVGFGFTGTEHTESIDVSKPVSVAITYNGSNEYECFVNGSSLVKSTVSSTIQSIINIVPWADDNSEPSKLINYRFYKEVLQQSDIQALHDFDQTIINHTVAGKSIDISGISSVQILIEGTGSGNVQIEGLLF